MTSEPRDHRGRPNYFELQRASLAQARLERLADRLVSEQGFIRRESYTFIAGVAYEKGIELGETWTTAGHAVRTLSDLIEGHGAKHWSLDALELACSTIESLFEPS